ncbi:hypothetical protein CYMTET_54758 [Cymbomonas tetramitiformis]|uniref:Uncharacterized protein n=1 Tax=Cymbomonas tetramitiformis TaxID=36881 RepID=A0AAE0BG40_9CHLO|nr:hypothetical protein CYMTET_54758 [Cymbomonas tetramitiformis]
MRERGLQVRAEGPPVVRQRGLQAGEGPPGAAEGLQVRQRGPARGETQVPQRPRDAAEGLQVRERPPGAGERPPDAGRGASPGAAEGPPGACRGLQGSR